MRARNVIPSLAAAFFFVSSVRGGAETKYGDGAVSGQAKEFRPVTIFMSGDVMVGRGIDQILPHPGDPLIHEPYAKSARDYVELAERANGPIPQPAAFTYIWGDALSELQRRRPDLRIINLETSITAGNDYMRGKSIHYRMHPENAGVLTAAGIDVCSLANNHTLDWGESGLIDTLETLRKVRVTSAGAGRNEQEAGAPAVMDVDDRARVIVFSYGEESSGIPRRWAASKERPGVNLLKDLSEGTVRSIGGKIREVKRSRDIVIFSVHWGGNWGYSVPSEQLEFAHKLIDEAGVDVIHGHSSHHVMGIEVYRNKLILYGCGDFLSDYEGIGGYEEFRAELTLMYFASVHPATGELLALRMVPMRVKNFRAARASRAESLWLKDLVKREGGKFGTGAEMEEDSSLILMWN